MQLTRAYESVCQYDEATDTILNDTNFINISLLAAIVNYFIYVV